MPWTTPETFTAGQTLTSASMNKLTENTRVLRPNIVTAFPSSPVEGDQVIYRHVNGDAGCGQSLFTYQGGAWRPEGGLHLIQTKTVSSSTGISFDNVFTDLFRSYRLVGSNIVGSTTMTHSLRMRVGGVANSSALYAYGGNYVVHASAANTNFAGTIETQFYVGTSSSSVVSACAYDFHFPATTAQTGITGTFLNFDSSGSMSGAHKVNTAYDGFTYFNSTGTFGGTFSVYGYAKDSA